MFPNGKQLECLHILIDGNWHDRRELSQKLKIFVPANVSGRIVRPLEKSGIIEQEERPDKEGSRRMKKFVRIRKDLDEEWLLEVLSLLKSRADELVTKYEGKNAAERAKIFFTMKIDFIKKIDELEERRRRAKEKYWKEKESKVPNSESWLKFVHAARVIAERFENVSKPHEKKRIPHIAFMAVIEAFPELSEEARRAEMASLAERPQKHSRLSRRALP